MTSVPERHAPQNANGSGQENANSADKSSPAGGRSRRGHHPSRAHELDGGRGTNARKRSGLGAYFAKVIDPFMSVVHTVMPPGGILSSAFNMASASIGAGILGLPGATDSAGLVLSMICLLVITFFSVYSMRVLSIAAEKAQIRSFEGLGRWLFPYGNYAFSYWVSFIRWFHAFSANVAYVISMGNCFKPLFDTAYARNPDNRTIRFFSTRAGNRLLTSLVWLFIMLPLVLPKHIDSLRHASAFAVTFMIYFVIIIVIHSCMNGLGENAGKVRLSDVGGYNPETDDNAVFLFRTGNSVVNSVGVFVFAYVCQINALEVWSDMPAAKRTTRNYTWAAFLAMMICGSLYVLVCVFGYFDFGSKFLLNQSILLMYDPLAEPAVLVAYVGVMCKLCVAYALLTIAARNPIYYIIGWQQRYAPRSEGEAIAQARRMSDREKGSKTSESRDEVAVTRATEPLRAKYGEDSVVEPAAGDFPGDVARAGGKAALDTPPEYRHIAPDEEVSLDDSSDITYIDNIPYWKHVIVVLILSVASLLCGLFIPSINMVFGFAGAISGGFMAFVFPALFFMYSGNWTLKAVGAWDYFLTYALLITGVIGIVFGTGGTIYNTI